MVRNCRPLRLVEGPRRRRRRQAPYLGSRSYRQGGRNWFGRCFFGLEVRGLAIGRREVSICGMPLDWK